MLLPKLVTTLQTYTRAQFLADLTAGVIVGIVALPLAIAFAIAGGVTPDRGLCTRDRRLPDFGLGWLAGANRRPDRGLRGDCQWSELLSDIGAHHVHDNIDEALAAARTHLGLPVTSSRQKSELRD